MSGKRQVVVVEKQELEQPLVGQNVQHVSRLWVHDRQPVHLFLDQGLDRVEQTCIRIDGAEGSLVTRLKYL